MAFIGLVCCCDREGRFKWRPEELKPDILPNDSVDFGAVLDALHDAGFVVRYEVEGDHFGHIPTFKDHQHINLREAGSKIPAPQGECAHVLNTATHRNARGEGKGREGKGVNQTHSTSSSSSRAHAYAREDVPLAAASIATYLRAWERDRKKAARGITASNQQVIDLADLHVSVDELRRAYDAAVADREATENSAPVNASFIRVFVGKLRHPPRKREDNGWRRTPAGIERKASELGIVCPPGRNHDWLAEKCESVMRQRAQANGAA
ncbi:hypothetical protein [Paraburkholderia silvatlantica]|uniref:hypothetical protein n=1 Tax=Paraburkholderia silvatlantica TaxID=321895 RepID=UPI0037525A11